ncbi:MAG: hypothetical protein JW791_02230 [Nanoarchaeota archaeon]|nr:hypothetical protein [Nanoarchaeota archaeon]
MADDKKEKNLNDFVKVLLGALIVMLVIIISFIYRAVVSQSISLPFLMTAILILVIPTFFIIMQLITALSNRLRRNKLLRRKNLS